MSYSDFLTKKQLVAQPAGFEVKELSPHLFDFQEAVTRWALRLGRAAIFAGTGLGKTAMQLEFAKHVVDKTSLQVLILAPLAVTQQTQREGVHFGIPVTVCQDSSDLTPGINITNYDRLERFDLSEFGGLILDESSILKSQDGATRTAIIEGAQSIPYRLACTATPSPNDFMELGNHSEFVGSMTRQEMLSMFFVHDGGETQKWRLKGHAQDDFWKWVCSWAVMFDSPADLGFDGSKFELPPLNMISHIVESTDTPEGLLFAVEAQTLQERQRARRTSTIDRVAQVAEIVAQKPDESWLVWCGLNAEGDALTAAIPDAVQVVGNDTRDFKAKTMLGFTDGSPRILVSKSSICGFGMNWQHCSNVVFVGLSDSFEQFFQAVRRCWRFGQTRAVNCHVVTSSAEGAVVANIKRKEQDMIRMRQGMVKHMAVHTDVRGPIHSSSSYSPKKAMELPQWLAA